MKILSTNKVDTNKVELEIGVDAEAFELAIQQTFRKNAKNITVPGFRKGKAPRKMIERLYGESFFFEDAINATYGKALSEAVEEAKLDIVTKPEVEITSVSKDEGYQMKATCIVKPEVEVSDYKGIEIEKTVKTVTDTDVEQELGRMQERNGRIVSVEGRPAQKGDNVTFDFEGFIDGQPFEGGKAEGHSLVLGSGQFIPGFEEQIEGHNVEDTFEVNVVFPEDYHAEEIKGKPATFKCKLHDIKTRELPELDDEFAKDVSEFDTLEELKEDVRKKLEEEAVKKSDTKFESDLMEKVIDKMTAEVPQEMYDSRIDDLVHDFEHRLQHQGMTLDVYKQYTGTDDETIRGQFAEQAEKQVKVRLALEKIAEIEDIQVSDEDLEKEYEKFAEMYKMELDKIKEAIPAENIREDIKVSKAVDLIKDSAKITEVAEEPEQEKPEEEKPAKKTTKKTSAKKTEEDTVEKPKRARKKAAKKDEEAAE